MASVAVPFFFPPYIPSKNKNKKILPCFTGFSSTYTNELSFYLLRFHWENGERRKNKKGIRVRA